MMKKRSKEAPVGTLRIGSKDLKVYERTNKGWRVSKKGIPDALQVAKLFKSHGKVKEITDKKGPRFLKGQLSPKCKPQGARINILPDGKKLDKAFSLFAPHLTIHDESSESHWDVIYQNPNGDYSYVYTLDKKAKASKNKYKKVEEFGKDYPQIKRKALNDLKKKGNALPLAIYTLLKTYMRVGNEIYYRTHGHKGLTTIQKKDISISGNKVEFDYLGKDGAPLRIEANFPESYIKTLKLLLAKIKNNSFVFVNESTGKPLKDTDLKKEFYEYCGKEFYPHIVRSYFATSKVKDFLRKNKKFKKEELERLFNEIAEKLGHKKFVKKDGEWEANTKTTIQHYIKPELVEKAYNKVKG